MNSNSKPEYPGIMFCNGDSTEIFRENFDALPPSRKDRVISILGNPKIIDGDKYSFPNSSVAETSEALRIMTAYFDNQRSRKRRLELELECEGIFLSEDLNAIYEIQEGKCYFSGEPISLEKKNYSVDHLKPVRNRGSFWPNNLALVTKATNQEKHGQPQKQYWDILKARNGSEWVKKRKAWCIQVDKKRRAIDRDRRAVVRWQVSEINSKLQKHYHLYEWQEPLSFENGCLRLEIDGIEVYFPPGFIRQKKKWDNAAYLITLVDALQG